MKPLKTGALMAALLSASACENAGFEMPSFEMPELDMSFLQPAPKDSAAMFLGLAKVRGPEGYCIDRAASRLAQGFAILLPCAVLDEDAETTPEHSAFVTVQLGSRGSAAIAGNEDLLLDEFETKGASEIFGDPPLTEILETEAKEGAVAAHYRVERTERSEALTAEVWRLFADVDGRLATISLRSPARAPLSAEQGRELLFKVLTAMRDVNA